MTPLADDPAVNADPVAGPHDHDIVGPDLREMQFVLVASAADSRRVRAKFKQAGDAGRVRPIAKSSSDSPTSMMKITSAATRNYRRTNQFPASRPRARPLPRDFNSQIGGDLAVEQAGQGAG